MGLGLKTGFRGDATCRQSAIDLYSLSLDCIIVWVNRSSLFPNERRNTKERKGKGKEIGKKTSLGWDSNLRPTTFHADALTA